MAEFLQTLHFSIRSNFKYYDYFTHRTLPPGGLGTRWVPYGGGACDRFPRSLWLPTQHPLAQEQPKSLRCQHQIWATLTSTSTTTTTTSTTPIWAALTTTTTTTTPDLSNTNKNNNRTDLNYCNNRNNSNDNNSITNNDNNLNCTNNNNKDNNNNTRSESH